MHFARALLLSLIADPLLTHALSLLDTLRQDADASIFAQLIESNPTLAAFYQSDSVKTVYAPVDKSLKQLRRRQSVDVVAAQRQSQKNQESARDLRSQPGKVVYTNDNTGNLNGESQAVVAHSVPDDNSNNSKRALFPRQGTNATVGAVTISSGLGKNVSIIRGDIPYDGGIIHTVDGFFTKPIALSATSNQTGNTQFASRLGQSNLTGLLDNTSSITVFLPSDAAFAAAGNISQTSAQIASQLSDHIVTNKVLYLPLLVDGATYQTKAGRPITVSVRAGRYFINGAQIIQSDLILENGVAHIINKVIPPAAAPVPAPPFTGIGSSTATFNLNALTILGIATAFLMYSLS